ncbi:hypothetical protein KIH07_18540 [Hydrogenophaga taeniospiralis]|uniref:hypothetical protein n=1 Tax=Hydrogenophaga taeniospiralis TaxID=65656 RepID=UPI001CF9E97A|nr:hypothetical protein [Hydrogenophaga taeniospiralis]MCB4365739.1 hypothetical protein [Hydrogenophaga taeniospiralis]
MSNVVTNAARKWHGSPAQKAVLMALADGAADDGVVPGWRSSITALCEWTCLGRTAVIQAMKALGSSGLVEIDRSFGRVSKIRVSFTELPNQSATRTSPGNEPVRETDPHQSGKRTGPVRETDRTSTGNGPLTPIHQTPETSEGERARAQPPIDQPSVDDSKQPKAGQPDTAGQKKTKPKADSLYSMACPDDVDAQTWGDWLLLRRAKRAAVTSTVLKGARVEAEKAGMALDAFLQCWCRRGSQGLEASWLKDTERNTVSRVRTTQDFSKTDYTAGHANGRIL